MIHRHCKRRAYFEHHYEYSKISKDLKDKLSEFNGMFIFVMMLQLYEDRALSLYQRLR